VYANGIDGTSKTGGGGSRELQSADSRTKKYNSQASGLAGQATHVKMNSNHSLNNGDGSAMSNHVRNLISKDDVQSGINNFYLARQRNGRLQKSRNNQTNSRSLENLNRPVGFKSQGAPDTLPTRPELQSKVLYENSQSKKIALLNFSDQK
jgi:hypothetical protein